MREDLDPQAAERLVAEQVALGRQQGRVTVPEVAKAVGPVIWTEPEVAPRLQSRPSCSSPPG